MSAISYIKECIVDQMSDMTTERKLDFLTDIFILTEDLRHELSESDPLEEEVQGESTVVVRGASDKAPCGDCCGQEKRNGPDSEFNPGII